MSLSRVKFVAETLIYVQNFLSSCYAKLKPCGGRSKPLLPTSKYQPESKAYTATKHAIGASFVVGILLIPVFLLLWIRMSRLWTSFTVSFSMLIFAFVMGSFSRLRLRMSSLVLRGKFSADEQIKIVDNFRRYCAVLATCVSNSGVA
jgi:hypothetical protein